MLPVPTAQVRQVLRSESFCFHVKSPKWTDPNLLLHEHTCSYSRFAPLRFLRHNKRVFTWTVVLKVRRFPVPNCFVYHLDMHAHMSNHQRFCFENNTLPVLWQTVLPHQSFSPLSDRPITSAHYPTARSERRLWSHVTNPQWPRRAAVTGFWRSISHSTGLVSPLLSEVLDLLFICVQSLTGRCFSEQVWSHFIPRHSAPTDCN